jgi:hypothetical protein
VFWGITPTQAGIFAVDNLNKSAEFPSMLSTTYPSLSQQGETLSAESAHSVANIMWLNESLPPLMTREFVLAPFGPSESLNTISMDGNWTGPTLKYSVDVDCETPATWISLGSPMVNSSWGCHFQLPPFRHATDDQNKTKIFDTLYVGYFNDDGLADHYLSDGSCPPSENNTFLIQWSKTPASIAFNSSIDFSSEEQFRRANVTTLFCRSSYNVQDVEATIHFPSKEVLGYRPISKIRPLPRDLFNTSNFEASMSMGHERFLTRTEFPTTNWPDQTVFLENMPLNLGINVPKMTPFAIGASQLPLDAYLDPITLRDSYQSAYRLLFARQLANVLSPNLDPNTKSTGRWSYQTQSIILVPAFTYIVEALLGIVILFASIILYNSCVRRTRLLSNPATIAAIMSLVADDSTMISKLKGLDRATEEQLRMQIRNRRFRLVPMQSASLSYRIQLLDLRGNEDIEAINDELMAVKREKTSISLKSDDEGKVDVVDGIQPLEFSLKIGLVFLITQVALLVLIGAIFINITRNNGLPLPSSNRFVRQLLENYLPTAVGTLIEPFWVVLNRHLCSLQPFEALRKGKADFQNSIAQDYTSLPPQLVIGKAIAGKNFLLATVCGMTLLANVLAVSLSGLFFESSVNLPVASQFYQQFSSKFASLDGSAAPITQVRGGTVEPFYIATSNQTARTPLPPWTDNLLFYQPFSPLSTASSLQHQNLNRRAITRSLGAQLSCDPLSAESTFTVTGTGLDDLGFADILSSGNLTVSLMKDNRKITCIPRQTKQEGKDSRPNFISARPTGPSAYEFSYALDGLQNGTSADAPFCREHVAAGWVRGNLVNGTSPKMNLTDFLPSIVTSYDSTVIVCRGTIVTGLVDATVSEDGHVVLATALNTSTPSTNIFSTTASDVLGQAHQFILHRGMIWHNDSFPSDFSNYLLAKVIGSDRLVDPKMPPPSFEDVAKPFEDLYAKLFAIWVGQNKEQLLVPAQNEVVHGYTIQPTLRIFMSIPMFAIAETILTMYIVVTIILYLQRPWRILCRMPTSPASVIAFFAAGNALKDMRKTAGMSSQDRWHYLSDLNAKYGFGTFIGTDSKTHVGIEKHPFLAPLTREGSGFQHQDSSSSSRTFRDDWRSKFVQWKSGKVREGGWM